MEDFDALRAALNAETWETVERDLLRKILAEFCYEDLITPARAGTVPADESDPGESWTRYRLRLDGGVEYRFDAQSRPLDSYRVREGSVFRRGVGESTDVSADGEATDADDWTEATDPLRFLLDAREYVGIDPTTAAHLVREYRNTLVADAHIRARKADAPADASILDLPYAEVEGEMEGHPWFTYNKGRVGFGYDDYLRYAPESKRRQRLSWVAARRDRATFSAVEGLDRDDLLESELGDTVGAFRATLADEGLDPENYHFLPVHDWQWNDSVVQLFAGDIADDAIVPLGEAPDEYLPQQSIRTFSNVSDPTKRHVKLPIRVLNTNVYRGILGEQAEAAPRVTEFVKGVRDGDAFLRDDCDLLLPGEVASVNYEHPYFSAFDDAPYQFHELLGCVWRESVVSMVEDGERPLTLAALLHEDFDGTPLVSKLVERCGLELSEWLDRLFDVLLHPLVHYLYKYGTVFMPHGTNVVLVHEGGVPTRIAVKDFVDEVAITDRDLPELDEVLADDLRDDERYDHHILHRLPPEPLCQHVFGTLFVGVFRYVADLLARREGYDEERFWGQVRSAIERYQAQFPGLDDRFETFDLFRPRFTKHCLNRNRIVDYGYQDFSTRPKVRGHGTVPNPLSEFGDRRDH
ncbi:IucA/IucC family siderophore biosynthesis protein [Halorussus sp. MSC15.2]|uniref:IucA/IucC family protein n=1 Tax=Halorussus sp. MSC15.2 TaxID=2283638 RepID=UPI0013D80542|nr:IucA/IucC family siderophore biosynthesis protein [Halorussus sp. MSC15.2]NEU57252.1 IucA/IucC family siderophore biosynthesis protein [Halorussus sp. MSC15.2]